jgi:mycofactocin precursor
MDTDPVANDTEAPADGDAPPATDDIELIEEISIDGMCGVY